MTSPLMRALLVVGVAALNPLDLRGQVADHPMSSVILAGACGSGLRGGGPECSIERRLLVDLRRRGAGAPEELLHVVDIGATLGGAFALTPQQATPADSLLYVIMDVARDASGEYRIEKRAIGSGLKLPDCAGHSTGRVADLAFGAVLALETAQLVQCAQSARTKATRK